jgi:type VI secretion system secreted protein VgrG
VDAKREYRNLEITTPLGDGVLVLDRFSGRDELGRLSSYQAVVSSQRKNISAKDILGKNVTVEIDTGGEEPRYINGYVTRFSLAGGYAKPDEQDNYRFTYELTIHPWIWFLTRTSTCQIFQKKDVRAVLKEVFGRKGISDIAVVEDRLSRTYDPWEYCVQYRETDFNFVSRMMEQEGIYYHLEHGKGKHVLVLTDEIGKQHKAHPRLERIEFNPEAGDGALDKPYVSDWDVQFDIQPGRYAHDDYDFTNPRAELARAKEIARSHDRASFEIFDYPGEYDTTDEGDRFATLRIEELQCQHEQIYGVSNAREIQAGRLITLTGHPIDSQNREYLITSCSVQASAPPTASGSDGGFDYSCSFSVIPSKVVEFRAARVTPKPMVQGPQTAVVVGPKGKEIDTDEYGRVRVQFHWDRYGKGDENSSCWVRVSQPWAGREWGGIAIPRIGQEVIVEFLEGDPDWPIITGRLYNEAHKPPYELPTNATQTGIKSRSSPDGSAENFNELRFEDKKGAEEVFLHAERDLITVVKEGNREATVKKGNDHLTVTKGDVTNEAPVGTYTIKAKEVVIEAAAKITLKVGGSTIVVDPAQIAIKGGVVKIN